MTVRGQTAVRPHPLPAAHRVVEVDLRLTADEFRALQAGLVPRDMDDRWWVIFRAPWAYLHRSWTGFCVYAARCERVAGGVRVVELQVNDDPEQYQRGSDDDERRLFESVLRHVVFARSSNEGGLEMVHDPVESFRQTLKRLRAAREGTKAEHRRGRERLTAAQRQQVLQRTKGHCHVCGGLIGAAERWQADHVVAHSGGGPHDVDNYLAAHPTCNNYRWDYRPEEFEQILKLGVWLRTQIETGSAVGRQAAAAYLGHEARRERRRVPRDSVAPEAGE